VKRVLVVLAGLLALVVLPPLWFLAFPGDPPPELPPPGRRVQLAGGTGVNVLEAGSGPAVVLVHGLPGSAYDWRETTAALAARGRSAIAYDRVGFGRSDPRRDGRSTPEANADELLALLEALDLRDATVVGWSYGGATAMIAAMRKPPRIARLVLVGTGGPDSPDARAPEPSLPMRLFNSDAALRWRALVPPVGIALMKAISAAAFSDGPQPDWWLAGVRANLARWETRTAYRDEMLGLAGESTGTFDPSAIAVPTLLLHGDDDRLASVGIARYLHTRIPGSTLVELPGGSHMLPVTHAPELADRIAAFSAAGR
jgi:pimeloyl-ACP methyl ester carboxylesterase